MKELNKYNYIIEKDTLTIFDEGELRLDSILNKKIKKLNAPKAERIDCSYNNLTELNAPNANVEFG